jgi:hypothetical protein
MDEEIKCDTCGKIITEVEKDSIIRLDIEKKRISFLCSCNHVIHVDGEAFNKIKIINHDKKIYDTKDGIFE